MPGTSWQLEQGWRDQDNINHLVSLLKGNDAYSKDADRIAGPASSLLAR